MDRRLTNIAKKVCWHATSSPELVISDTDSFLCRVLCYGSDKDIEYVQSKYSREQFIDALYNCPKGLFNLCPERWRKWCMFYFGEIKRLPLPIIKDGTGKVINVPFLHPLGWETGSGTLYEGLL